MDYPFLRWLKFDGAPGLDKESDPATLDARSTPDAYGLNLDVEGRLAAGSIPTGTARIAKSATTVADVTAATADYTWLYDRLWKIGSTTTQLLYGAPRYDNFYFKQGLGRWDFNEDANAIIAFIPFGGDSLAIGKSTGSYILSGLTDPRGEDFWRRSDIMQEITLATAANATELDDVAYFSNATGLWAFVGPGKVEEITRPIRNSLTGFTSLALTCDYGKARVIGSTKFVYDAAKKRLYDYNTTGFLWTSPVFHEDAYQPFYCARLVFMLENTAESDKTFQLALKMESEPWRDPDTLDVLWGEGRYSKLEYEIPFNVNVRRLQIKIPAMDSGVRIRAIHMDVSGNSFDGYSL